MQVAEIEDLNQEKVKLAEEKDGFEIQNPKLAEEASYAKELASAEAVELRNLSEEVTRLSYQNAKLISDLAVARELSCVRIEELQKELRDRCQREASLETALSERESAEYDLQKRLEEALENELANMWVIARIRGSEDVLPTQSLL